MGHVLVGIVDSIMVGQIGKESLAASAFANNVLGIFLMFGIGLSYGITPLVAQADGQGDDKMIVHVLRNGILLCAFAGAGLFLLLLGLAQLMPYMAQPADVLAMGKPTF